jgi:hypothetical protein
MNTEQQRIAIAEGKLLRHEKAYLEKLITHTIDKCQGRPCCVHNPSKRHETE